MQQEASKQVVDSELEKNKQQNPQQIIEKARNELFELMQIEQEIRYSLYDD